MDRMCHKSSKRSDPDWDLTGLQSLPIYQQFSFMQFRPSFNQTRLASWQCSGNQLHRLDLVHGNIISIVRMKMRRVMRSAGFQIHSNDYTEKSGKFGHGNWLNGGLHRFAAALVPLASAPHGLTEA